MYAPSDKLEMWVGKCSMCVCVVLICTYLSICKKKKIERHFISKKKNLKKKLSHRLYIMQSHTCYYTFLMIQHREFCII